MDIPTAVVERKKYGSKQEFEAAIIEQLDLHHVELVLLAGLTILALTKSAASRTDGCQGIAD